MKNKEFSRRDFLKGTVGAGVGIITGSYLTNATRNVPKSVSITESNLGDSDLDGISDYCEIDPFWDSLQSYNPTDVLATDTDGDGISDYNELEEFDVPFPHGKFSGPGYDPNATGVYMADINGNIREIYDDPLRNYNFKANPSAEGTGIFYSDRDGNIFGI